MTDEAPLEGLSLEGPKSDLLKSPQIQSRADRHGASLQPEPSWTVGMRGAAPDLAIFDVSTLPAEIRRVTWYVGLV